MFNKVLILSASAGAGHVRAADALQKAFTQAGAAREVLHVDALDYTNKVGAIAESEGHHPDVYLGWGKVKLSIWTHKIDGLTESDFILAAKADEAYRA